MSKYNIPDFFFYLVNKLQLDIKSRGYGEKGIQQALKRLGK